MIIKFFISLNSSIRKAFLELSIANWCLRIKNYGLFND